MRTNTDMRRHAPARVALLLAVACAGGCDAVDDPGADLEPGRDAADLVGRDQIANGQVLNSAVLNGIQFNGIQFNGIQFNGIQFNGIQFNGIQFNGIQFNDSALTGTIDLGDGPVVKTGADFIAAEMHLTAGATDFTLRFDDIYENPAQPGSGVWFHQVSVRDDAVGTWSPLCTDALGAPIEAILLPDHWDLQTGARVDGTEVVTFACRGAVLAKCVEWGYVPWRTATRCDGKTCTQVSLREHHQACTRMARADYCGTGHSYTFNNTPIDLFDKLSPVLQARTTAGLAPWTVEAEWGPNGATCVGDALRLQMYDAHKVPYTAPSCLDALHSDKCGDFKGRPESRIADAYCEDWESDPAGCGGVNDDKPVKAIKAPKPPKP